MDLQNFPFWLIVGLFILISVIVIIILLILFIALIKGREIKIWHITISGGSQNEKKEKKKKRKYKRDKEEEINIKKLTFKNLGNIKTKMLPIYPVNRNYPLSYENITFKYDTKNVYKSSKYQYLYDRAIKYIKNKKSVYNEASPRLLDYEITRNGELDEYFIKFDFGVQSYIDFLAINKNIDTSIENRKSIKELLQIENTDFDFLKNDLPKKIGLTSILITEDDKLVFQKRKKSVIASNMFHVSVAEGLQIYYSYDNYLKLNNIKRQQIIVDKDIETAIYRGYIEELGIKKNEITEIQLLSIYFDYELQQLIFQILAQTKLNSKEILNYFINGEGMDTVAEINSLAFINNKLDDILLYILNTSINDKWSSHGIINIISYIESVWEMTPRIIKNINKYFNNPKLFDLGKQSFFEKE